MKNGPEKMSLLCAKYDKNKTKIPYSTDNRRINTPRYIIMWHYYAGSVIIIEMKNIVALKYEYLYIYDGYMERK